jgi:hypothetical protein
METKEVSYSFVGMVNTKPPEALSDGELVSAVNVDIGDGGVASRRKGITRHHTGSAPHSCWSLASQDKMFFVDDGVLMVMDTSFNAAIVAVLSSNDPVVFAEVNDIVVYSNGTDIGYVDSSNMAYAMPSPVDEFKASIPPGTVLFLMNGTLFSGRGNLLIHSEAYRLYRDTRHSHTPLPSPIKAGVGLQTGVWISCGEQTIFLRGRSPKEFQWEVKANYPMVPFSPRKTDVEVFGLEGLSGECAIWMSTEGFCVGLPDGTMMNLSEGRVSYRPGESGAVQTYERDGSTYLIGGMSRLGQHGNVFAR